MSTAGNARDRTGPTPSSGDDSAFRPSISLGRVAGVEVGLHWSWLLIVGLLVWSLATVVFPDRQPGRSDAAYAAMGTIATLLLFACLVAHEMGHAVQARREGMRIDGITLWVFGGVARFSGMFPSAGAELRVALAGPLVTLVLGGVALALALGFGSGSAAEGVAGWLATTNLLLLAFNLLPALPLDGGRVLRALLWRRSGDFTRATRTAGALGRGFGQVMIGIGVALVLLGALGGLWLALIGWFLLNAAAAESQLAELRSVLADDRVADAMVVAPITVRDDATLQAFVDDVFARSRHVAYPVVDDHGAPTGELTFRAVAGVTPERWPSVTVGERAIPLEDTFTVDADAPLFSVAVELMQRPPNRALVLRDGALVGLLSITDVSRLLELRRLTPTPDRIARI
jgi:Zn-dependent protease/CBS domain-containing protein